MKILVPIRRVVDANVKVRVNTEGTDVDIKNAKMVINPFCEIALEEALRLKESGVATEVVAVCVGPQRCQEQLRTALALGVDRVVHVLTDEDLQPLAIAKTLKAIIEREKPELTIFGKQSIDSDNNQTGQMTAALTGMPQGTYVSDVEVDNDSVIVTREVDGGLQKIKLKLPAVLTTDLRLNEPRYVTLPNMMKAKRKPIDQIAFSDLTLTLGQAQQVLSIKSPPERNGGRILDSVEELVDKLRNEAGVI